MTEFRKVHDGVAGMPETHVLFQRHRGRHWEELASLLEGEFWETDEETYEYFFGMMPPRMMGRSCFVSLEATTGDIHSAFFRFTDADGTPRFFHASIAFKDAAKLEEDRLGLAIAALEPSPAPAP